MADSDDETDRSHRRPVRPSLPDNVPPDHDFLGVGPAAGGHVARCRCGWRSDVVQGGWTAGVAWQAHAQDAERPEGVHGHGTYRIELDRAVAVAVCACGWRSDPALTSGVAGALWDRHLEVLTA